MGFGLSVSVSPTSNEMAVHNLLPWHMPAYARDLYTISCQFHVRKQKQSPDPHKQKVQTKQPHEPKLLTSCNMFPFFIIDFSSGLLWFLKEGIWWGEGLEETVRCTMRAVRVTLVMLPKKREMQANVVNAIAPPLP